MTEAQCRIRPVGRALRVIAALGLLYLAGGADGLPWGIEWSDAVLGFVALPALTVLLGLAARHYADRPLRFSGALGIALNCALIVALVATPYTASGATLFYATTMLVAAWRRQPGCEGTVLSNVILGRDDQVGCPIFSPIDALEARQGSRRARRPAAAHD